MIVKRCGSCGQQVPLSTQGGGRCPYCNVRFGETRHVKDGSGWGGCFPNCGITVLLGALLLFGIAVSVALYARKFHMHHASPQTNSVPSPPR
jgi:hypothetical protein